MLQVHWDHVATTWKIDSSTVALRVAPKLTRSHIYPNGFEKMRVNLAFYVFSVYVLHAMDFYKEKIEYLYPNLEPTRTFVCMMMKLIETMTSRFPAEALRYVRCCPLGSLSQAHEFACATFYCYRPNSAKEAALDAMLDFLDKWEAFAKGVGFLSRSTSEGLRVTIHSTKALLKYLTETVGYKYLMTSHLSQDCLERSFGIVRQPSGANDHPTPAQFFVVIRYTFVYLIVNLTVLTEFLPIISTLTGA